MQDKLQRIIEAIEAKNLSLGNWAITVLSIIIVRIGIENFFDDLPFRFSDEFFYQFSHHFLTFLTIFLVALPIMRWAGQVSLRQATNILLLGFLVIWTPPIVDEIISRGMGLWSFYSFDSLMGLLERYVTFFGDKPDVGITYGVRTEVGIVVLFIAFYTWIKTRSVIRTLLAALFLYSALFIIGVLPSLVTILLFGFQDGFLSITEHDIARFMLSPASLFIIYPPSVTSVLAIKMSLVYAPLLVLIVAALIFFFHRGIFWALFHNARIPQMLYHGGLFSVGAALTYLYGQSSFRFDLFHLCAVIVLVVAVECAWLASVVANDLRDIAIDRQTNRHRPLVTGAIDIPTYQTIGLLFFATSIFFALIVSTQAALLLLAYQALAFLYSSDPLRLKRVPILASALAAAASLLIFFLGYLVFSVDKNINILPLSIPTFLFFAYLFLIPIKDFKDIAGDRADGVYTLPVLMGEVWAKRFIGSMIFFTFILSTLIFSVRSLFPLALFFGALAYWILQLSSPEHRYFRYQKLAGWYVLLAFSYGLFLAATLIQK